MYKISGLGLCLALVNVLITWCQKPELEHPDTRCPLTLEILTIRGTPGSILVRTRTARVHIAQVGRAWDPNCIRIPLGVQVLPPGGNATVVSEVGFDL